MLRVTAHGVSEGVDLASPAVVLGALMGFSEAGIWGVEGVVSTRGFDGTTLVIEVTVAPKSMPRASILPSGPQKEDRSGLLYAPSPHQFSHLFPFHILVDEHGGILQVRPAACTHGVVSGPCIVESV